jgi:hypothetical protein
VYCPNRAMSEVAVMQDKAGVDQRASDAELIALLCKAQDNPSGGVSHGFLSRTGMFFGRAFFPLFAIAIIVGTVLWGPWVSLGVTVIAIAAALRLL